MEAEEIRWEYGEGSCVFSVSILFRGEDMAFTIIEGRSEIMMKKIACLAFVLIVGFVFCAFAASAQTDDQGNDDRGMVGGYGGYNGQSMGMMNQGSGGYGMGQGMMRGHGYEMEQGYGRGYGQQYGGQQPPGPINEDEARQQVRDYLDANNDSDLRIGSVREQGNDYKFTIVGIDGSPVDTLLVNKDTGYMRSVH